MGKHCTYRQEIIKVDSPATIALLDDERVIDVIDQFDSRTYLLIERCFPVDDEGNELPK